MSRSVAPTSPSTHRRARRLLATFLAVVTGPVLALQGEILTLLAAGMEGYFTDNPDIGSELDCGPARPDPAEELGAVCDLQAWLAQHSVDPTDPLAKGIAGGAGRRAGSDGSPLVDEFAVREYAALRHQSEPTARALMTDIADLEHRFPKLWAAVQALWLPVGQARTIVAACRELSQEAAALVDTELAAVVAGLPWSRILTRLGAAIMTADPVLAEAKRQQAKSARFVQLCRSEDGINTMIVRADAGDLKHPLTPSSTTRRHPCTGGQHRTRRSASGDRVRAPHPAGDDPGDVASPHPRRHRRGQSTASRKRVEGQRIDVCPGRTTDRRRRRRRYGRGRHL